MWERSAFTRCAKHRERQDEDHELRPSIETTTKYVVVLSVPSRMMLSQPHLTDKANNDNRRSRRIHTD